METKRKTFTEELADLNACQEAMNWSEGKTLKVAWSECKRSDWMIWLLARTKLDQDDPRLRLMACDFAEAVLYLVPTGEDRPRKAIEVARRFAAGDATREEMAAASAAARDASAAWDAWDAACADWAAVSAASAAWDAVSADLAASAAVSACWAAASAAARDAARDSAWDAQSEIIRRYFPVCPPLK